MLKGNSCLSINKLLIITWYYKKKFQIKNIKISVIKTLFNNTCICEIISNYEFELYEFNLYIDGVQVLEDRIKFLKLN